jgi:hypothetical protein
MVRHDDVLVCFTLYCFGFNTLLLNRIFPSRLGYYLCNWNHLGFDSQVDCPARCVSVEMRVTGKRGALDASGKKLTPVPMATRFDSARLLGQREDDGADR